MADQLPKLGMGVDDLLVGLFKRAEDRLTDEDLLTVACAGEAAENIVGHISVLCHGLGCLIAEDADKEGNRAGNFQSGDDVAPMLWALGGMADHANGLLRLASWAGASREARARIKAPGKKRPEVPNV